MPKQLIFNLHSVRKPGMWVSSSGWVQNTQWQGGRGIASCSLHLGWCRCTNLEVSKADTVSKYYMQPIDGTQSSTNTTEEKEKEFILPKWNRNDKLAKQSSVCIGQGGAQLTTLLFYVLSYCAWCINMDWRDQGLPTRKQSNLPLAEKD